VFKAGRSHACAQEYEEETVRRFIQCMQARSEVEQRNVSERCAGTRSMRDWYNTRSVGLHRQANNEAQNKREETVQSTTC
jgi:hypothetical protein